MDHPVAGYSIADDDVAESVDSNVDETAVPTDINTEALALKQSRQVDVEESLWHSRRAVLRWSPMFGSVLWWAVMWRRRTVVGRSVFTSSKTEETAAAVALAFEHLLIVLTSVVVRIRVQRVPLADNMVGQQRLEVLLPIWAEEESVDPGAELLESEVAGREKSAAGMGAVELFQETGLLEAELEGGEFGGEQLDYGEDVGWGEDDGVDAVDYAVCAELSGVLVLCFGKGEENTYDVDSNNAGVEVD